MTKDKKNMRLLMHADGMRAMDTFQYLWRMHYDEKLSRMEAINLAMYHYFRAPFASDAQALERNLQFVRRFRGEIKNEK